MDFTRSIIASEGLICVDIPRGSGFAHRFFDHIDTAIEYAKNCDAAGYTVYLAQATFKTNENRKGVNALYMKSFFLDLDCDNNGETKDYRTQQDAAAALRVFVEKTKLPFPSVVNSGNGLYAYWVLDKAVEADRWFRVASRFKQLCAAADFVTDTSRTSDRASVLRPIGTHNKKGEVPKPVELVHNAGVITLDSFTTALEKGLKKFGVRDIELRPGPSDINDEFGTYEERPSDPIQAARKCNQLRSFANAKGNVPEPQWYAAIGVLRHCTGGEEVLQEWSSGHPEYSYEATQAKIQQHIDSGVGPTTCAYFAGIDASPCIGCAFSGKIKSPIVLGFPEPEKLEAPNSGIPAPKPFVRTKEGLAIHDEDSGETVVFYPHDLYPVRLQYDEFLGYETVTVRHYLTHEGWKEFTLRSSLVADPKAFMIALWDNHVKVIGSKGRKYMLPYFEGYMKELQNARKMSTLCSQMGWKERDGEPLLDFAVGDTLYHADGTADTVGFSKNVPSAIKGFRAEGDAAPWIEITEELGRPGFEAHAFTLLSALGAPLMRFTGYEGAMVSLVGETGSAKTLMQRWCLSIYGFHKDLLMLRDDTKNSLVSRLGIYGSLPLAIDEISNIDSMELSELAYRITQGRDKARLDRSARERNVNNQWNTLALVSTNHSLLERLASAKADASAEINRVFEYQVKRPAALDTALGAKIFNTIHANFGVVGQHYIKHLVATQPQHKAMIDKLAGIIAERADSKPEERFWTVVAAVSLYGGLLAQQMGLIKFRVEPIMDWVVETIKGLRAGKTEVVRDSVSLLGDYLAETQNSTLIVTQTVNAKRGQDVHVIQLPRNSLANRYEMDGKRILISVSALRAWVDRKAGNYGAVTRELRQMGALTGPARRVVLGSGTNVGGVAQFCLTVDLTCKNLGVVFAQVVADVEKQADVSNVAQFKC